MYRSTALVALGLLCAAPALAQPATLDSRHGQIVVQTVAEGLENPWGFAVLPDGRLLVSERPGRLRLVAADGRLSPPLGGVPRVFAERQGGLLDVTLAPDFAASRMVYFSFAEPGDGGVAGTAVARARLAEDRLENVQVIFRQDPKVDGGQHFGSRLVFGQDGRLFVTLGDRGKMTPAQDLGSHIGKVLRLNADGSVPPDNPFVGRSGAKPEIWTYGNRNIQAAALDPRTGLLWIAEMGPRGGDEMTPLKPGTNYGWPLVSAGSHYDGRPIPNPSTRPDLAGSAHYWSYTLAPSGMLFYTGNMFPEWQGNMLVGGLAGQSIVRMRVDGERATEEERLRMDARIRDLRQGLDGAVYAATDERRGKIVRLSRAGQPSQQPRN